MFHMNINRRVSTLIYEVGFPIILESRWDDWIEETLQNRVRNRAYQIESRRQEGPDRFEGLLCLFHGSRIAPDDATHGATVKVLGKGRSRRHLKKSKEPIDIFWRLIDELAIQDPCVLEYGNKLDGGPSGFII